MKRDIFRMCYRSIIIVTFIFLFMCRPVSTIASLLRLWSKSNLISTSLLLFWSLLMELSWWQQKWWLNTVLSLKCHRNSKNPGIGFHLCRPLCLLQKHFIQMNCRIFLLLFFFLTSLFIILQYFAIWESRDSRMFVDAGSYRLPGHFTAIIAGKNS